MLGLWHEFMLLTLRKPGIFARLQILTATPTRHERNSPPNPLSQNNFEKCETISHFKNENQNPEHFHKRHSQTFHQYQRVHLNNCLGAPVSDPGE